MLGEWEEDKISAPRWQRWETEAPQQNSETCRLQQDGVHASWGTGRGFARVDEKDKGRLHALQDHPHGKRCGAVEGKPGPSGRSRRRRNASRRRRFGAGRGSWEALASTTHETVE